MWWLWVLVMPVFVGVCRAAAPVSSRVMFIMLMMCHFMCAPRLWLGRLLLMLTINVLPRMRIMVPTCMLVAPSTAAWPVLH